MPLEKVDTIFILLEGDVIEPEKIIISVYLLYDQLFLQEITKVINL